MDTKLPDAVELQQQLQDLKKQFDDFLYYLPDAMLEVDLLARRLTYMNRMAYIVFGYAEADFNQGIPIAQLFAEGEYERAIQIIAGYVLNSLNQQIEYTRTGKQDLYEFFMRRKEGTLFCAETLTSFVLDNNRVPVKMRTLVRDISSRKQVDEALREAQQRFKSAFDNAPNGMALVSLDGRFLQINRSFSELMGRAEAELLNTSFQAITHPDDLDANLEQVQKILRGEARTYRTEKRYLHADGHVIHALLSTALVTDDRGQGLYFVSHVQDITERRRAEKELQEREALYRALFETVPVGLGIADRDGKLLAFNTAMLAPGGYTREDIEQIGNVANLYYDLEERARALALAQQQGYLDRHEVRFKRKDGSPYATLLSLRPIRINDEFCWQAVVEDISARKRAEESLHKHRQEQQVIFDSVPAMIWYKDRDNRILRVNKPAAAALRLPVNAIEGRSTAEFYPEEAEKYFADDQEVIRSGQPKLGIIEPMQISAGEKRWVQTDKVPYRDEQGNIVGVIVFAVDITERKIAEEALQKTLDELELRVQARTAELLHANVVLQKQIAERQRIEAILRHSEERYRVLYEDNPSLYFSLDAAGKILAVNRSGAEVLGYAVPELVGQSVLAVFDEEDKESVQQHLAACVQNPQRTYHWEFRKVRKDGGRLWVRETARAVRDTNGKTIILIVCEDITETRLLQQKTERMERLAALGQLSATIAHEIRNPLGSIRLNVQYLAGRLPIPPPYQKTFNQIKQGIDKIQDIITGILDFSRPAVPELRKTNLHKVLESSLRSTQHELEMAGIRLRTNYQAAAPEAWIDANLLGQVFVNLILNATDAMESGGELTIRTVSRDETIEIQIADTGKGIPPEDLEKIYDPFFTTKTDGIGLGLAFVTRIVEQHRAQIIVESQIGKGTQFTLLLPIAPENGIP
ncbi:MAG: Adaptive-response sensory-kinase SasA [bacterium]|nr:Adaptive-response sensory-kinase SasA [bacterium]